MEIVPYLLYSSVSILIGGVSYKYLKNDNVIPSENIESDYNLVNNDLTDTIVDIDRKSLGTSLDGKLESIKKICKEECGIDNNIKNRSKLRQRLKRYVKEYENIGHKEFVKNHKKPNFTPNILC
tara:strand:- start:307 stop:678 length:372 start_codon:yes stop_codon:yes gene_type:complete